MAVLGPNERFRRAERAFVAKQFAAARVELSEILASTGAHEAVLHLLALVEKADGRLDAAASAFVRALKRAPGNGQIRNNYANLLIAQGRPDAALVQFDQILLAQPDLVDARINRVLVLQMLGKAHQALTDIVRLAEERESDARVQSLAGSIAFDTGEIEAAGVFFDRALAIEPARTTALAGRGRIALERGEADAESWYERALAHGAQDPALFLSQTLAAEASGAAGRAIEMLHRAVSAAPFWAEGQAQLVRMSAEAGLADAFSTYRTAAGRADAPIEVTRGYLTALSQADRNAEIIGHVRALGSTAESDPLVQILYAGALSNEDHAEADARIELASTLPGGDIVAARHWLKRGDPQCVQNLLVARADAGVRDVASWAYLGLAWRMLGDPRAEWLYSQPGLYGAMTLDLSPEQLTELTLLLRGLHHARAHPIGQSMRGGTQTRGNLFRRQEPNLRALASKLEVAIRHYAAALPPLDPKHPLLRWRQSDFRMSGSWSVRLGAQGYHVNHIHPDGVMSSALYIEVPNASDEHDARAGWLELGRPPADLGLSLEPIATIKPVPGRLALFPSYFFHGTRRFKQGERLTIAFDVSAG